MSTKLISPHEADSSRSIPVAVVQLNVGGQIFAVGPNSIEQSSLLVDLISSDEVLRDGNGNLFIDESPEDFGVLIRYLRRGEVPFGHIASTLVGNYKSKSMERVADCAWSPSSILSASIRVFDLYGVAAPRVCRHCRCLFDPQRVKDGSCLRHSGTLSFDKSQTAAKPALCFSCCGSEADSLGCHSGRHEQLLPARTKGQDRRPPATAVATAAKTSTDDDDFAACAEAGYALGFCSMMHKPIHWDPNNSNCRRFSSGQSMSTDNSADDEPASGNAIACRVPCGTSACADCSLSDGARDASNCFYLADIEDATTTSKFFTVNSANMLPLPLNNKMKRSRSAPDNACPSKESPTVSLDGPRRSSASAALPGQLREAGQDAPPMESTDFKDIKTQTDFVEDTEVDDTKVDDTKVDDIEVETASTGDNVKNLQRVSKKKCKFCKKGKCSKESQCPFFHSVVDVWNPKFKTRMCPFFKCGMCSRLATECKFAHSLDELRATADYFKTQLCVFWLAGRCRAGASCRHAHGGEEIRSAGVVSQHGDKTPAVEASKPNDPVVLRGPFLPANVVPVSVPPAGNGESSRRASFVPPSPTHQVNSNSPPAPPQHNIIAGRPRLVGAGTSATGSDLSSYAVPPWPMQPRGGAYNPPQVPQQRMTGGTDQTNNIILFQNGIHRNYPTAPVPTNVFHAPPAYSTISRSLQFPPHPPHTASGAAAAQRHDTQSVTYYPESAQCNTIRRDWWAPPRTMSQMPQVTQVPTDSYAQATWNPATAQWSVQRLSQHPHSSSVCHPLTNSNVQSYC